MNDDTNYGVIVAAGVAVVGFAVTTLSERRASASTDSPTSQHRPTTGTENDTLLPPSR
jgi:hypothetical protein